MKKGALAMALAFLVTMVSGCGPKAEEPLTRIVFERGHGSAWGNQFRIELSPEEIVSASYIPQGTSELITVEHIPLAESAWDRVKTAVEGMSPERVRTDFWGRNKLDGTEYRKLTLIYGEKAYEYRLPDTPEGKELERQLELLLN